MTAAIDFMLLHGQNFAQREFQYRVIDNLEKYILGRQIVKHKVTKEKFVMKMIPYDAPYQIKKQAERELLALQKTASWDETLGLTDYFTDSQ